MIRREYKDNSKKLWYEIYGDVNSEVNILLAKVKSPGLAYIVGQTLSHTYTNIVIR